MNKNSKFLEAKAEEVRVTRAMAPSPTNMVKNISRLVEQRDRTDEEFEAFIEVNNVGKVDQNGLQRIPLDRATLAEFRADQAAHSVTSSGW